MEWGNIIVGNGSGYQAAITFSQYDLVPCLSNLYPTVTLDTHGDDKAVVFNEVTMECFRQFHHTNTEIL